jgi:TonB-linked SusC/RagA family outer membrane protein
MKRLIPSVVFGLALLLLPGLAWAQQGTVTGTVTEAETGEPLPGATVQIADENTGAASDAEGQYRITSIPAGEQTLRVSFVGYQAEERTVNVPADGTVRVNFQLRTSQAELEEVVVQAYGGQQTTGEVSGSVASIEAESIEEAPQQSAQGLLQGRAAGVTVTQTSGNPGSGFEVNIRGEGSINAGTQPLYIVDGVQVSFSGGSETTDTSPLNAIDPSNIESIEVLKDAAASAIYGAQAANGVVLINTKEGTAGETRVSVNFEGGARLQNYNFDSLSQENWIDLQIDALGETGFRQGILPTYGLAPDTPLSEVPSTDWENFISRTGSSYGAGFSATGGNETTQFFLSGNWEKTNAALKSVAYQDYNFRVNVTQEFTEQLDVDVKVGLQNSDQPGVCQDGFFINCPFSAIQFEPPITKPYEDDGSYYPFTSFGQSNNPAVVLNEARPELDQTQIIGNISPSFQIASWLRLDGQLGLDYQQIRETDYETPTADPGGGGNNQIRNAEVTNLTTNATLNANRTFGGVHDVGVLVGGEYRREFIIDDEFGVEGFNNPFFRVADAASSINFFQGENSEFRLLSGFGSINYSYDDRYVVRLTGRADGSSRFGTDRQFGFFPSASVAWRVSNEEFFSPEFINNLKVRASYGVTGNSSIGGSGTSVNNFASRGLYQVSGSYEGTVGVRPGQLANPQLTWEEKEEFNLAVDYGLFGDRITGSFDVYRSTSSKLLLNRPLPSNSGFGSITQNLGEVRNEGIEVQVKTINLRTDDFQWSTRFNAGINRNEVLSLSEGQEELNAGDDLPVAVGHSLEAWKVPLWAGVNPADGRPMFYDQDGNITYRPTEADDQFFDGGEEDVQGGFGTRISYKGLSLDAFFQFSYGSTSLPNTERAFLSNQGAFSAGLGLLNDRWKEPGDITDVARAVPSGVYPNADDFNRVSSYWLYDSSYIRLKNVRLGYQLPTSVTERLQIRGARIYVSGFNLITWTSYIGLDPEVAGAFNESSYPSEKQFNVGIEVNL